MLDPDISQGFYEWLVRFRVVMTRSFKCHRYRSCWYHFSSWLDVDLDMVVRLDIACSWRQETVVFLYVFSFTVDSYSSLWLLAWGCLSTIDGLQIESPGVGLTSELLNVMDTPVLRTVSKSWLQCIGRIRLPVRYIWRRWQRCHLMSRSVLWSIHVRCIEVSAWKVSFLVV